MTQKTPKDTATLTNSLAAKIDVLLEHCLRLREENEKLRADNSRMRTQEYGMRLNERGAYRDVKAAIEKVQTLEKSSL